MTNEVKKFSRRDFLKWAAGAAVTAVGLLKFGRFFSDKEGRYTSEQAELESIPEQHYLDTAQHISESIDALKNDDSYLDEGSKEITQAFDREIFQENIVEHVDKLHRLKKTFKEASNIRDEAIRERVKNNLHRDFKELKSMLDALCNAHDLAEIKSPHDAAVGFYLLSGTKQTARLFEDPLLGKDIYPKYAMSSVWFKDFDRNENIVFPVSRRFIKDSGSVLKHEASKTFLQCEETPLKRPAPFKYKAEASAALVKNAQYDETEKITIPDEVSTVIIDDIRKEMKKVGLERLFSELSFFHSENIKGLLGVVFLSEAKLINIQVPKEFTVQFYFENKLAILSTILHEGFHTIIRNLDKLSDAEAYHIVAVLEELQGEIVDPIKDILKTEISVPDLEKAMSKDHTVNTWRSSSEDLESLNLHDIREYYILLVSGCAYDQFYGPLYSFWKQIGNKWTPLVFEGWDSNFTGDVRKDYEEWKNNINNHQEQLSPIEKLILPHLNEHSFPEALYDSFESIKNINVFSEIVTLTILQQVLSYESEKFFQAVADELEMSDLSEEEKTYNLWALYTYALKNSQRYTLQKTMDTYSPIVEESLAELFFLSYIQLPLDTNLLDSLQAKYQVHKAKDIFDGIIEFLKSKNLVKNDLKSEVV